MNSFYKSLTLWLVIGMVMVLLFNLFNYQKDVTQEINFTDFMHKVEAGEVSDVTEYVLSLSGGAEDQAAAGRGEALFADNCAGCHGEDGRGNTEFGAPNLADAIWLYGGDRSTIAKTVANSRQSVMPAWTGRLDEITIKQLAIYVHALGGGQ